MHSNTIKTIALGLLGGLIGASIPAIFDASNGKDFNLGYYLLLAIVWSICTGYSAHITLKKKS